MIRQSIAAAVSLEIERIAKGQQSEITQGAAFKAEWDRRGSDALQLCHDAGADMAVFSLLVKARDKCGRRFSMPCVVALTTALLSGCAGLPVADMTAAQIRATNGMSSCGTASNLYGKVSIITQNQNDPAGNTNQRGKTVITCGEATMTIDNSQTVAPR